MLPAQMVGLCLSYNESKNKNNSKDNDYKNNSLRSINPTLQKEESDNDKNNND
jgi:hypothetical protein